MRYVQHDSPIGPLLLAGSEAGLGVISFPAGSRARAPDEGWEHDGAAFPAARRALDAYFAGERPPFNVPLAPAGTPFQHAVWDALRKIPYGATTSYGAIAAAIGRPKASRAVGAANGANPLPIIVPCHRVIGASGALTGFGGGLDIKVFLLELEGARRPAQAELAL